MEETIWSVDTISALETAISSGAKEVFYGDKKVVYRDLKEMLEILKLMKAAVYPDPQSNGFRRSRRLSSFAKGL